MATLQDLSYGIAKPEDLLRKLELDAARLSPTPNPHDVFNFVITAAVLNEWVRKCFVGSKPVSALISAQETRDYKELPEDTEQWIADKSCLPGRGIDARFQVLDALSICWHTANASKHFRWTSRSEVTSFDSKPVIKNWYQYAFTSFHDDLYVEYDGRYYGLMELRGILVQFYTGLLNAVAQDAA